MGSRIQAKSVKQRETSSLRTITSFRYSEASSHRRHGSLL